MRHGLLQSWKLDDEESLAASIPPSCAERGYEPQVRGSQDYERSFARPGQDLKKAGPRKAESMMESRAGPRGKASGKRNFSTGSNCRGIKAETLGKLGRSTLGQRDL